MIGREVKDSCDKCLVDWVKYFRK